MIANKIILPSVGEESHIRVIMANSLGVFVNSLGVLFILEKGISFTVDNLQQYKL